jgi:hypothetical protein
MRWPSNLEIIQMAELDRGPLLLALQSRETEIGSFLSSPESFLLPFSACEQAAEGQEIAEKIELIESLGWDHPDAQASAGSASRLSV